MTGPEHYREAERHLSTASYTNKPGSSAVDPAAAAHHLELAEVHAMLALAAATAMPTARTQLLAEMKAWSDVAGTVAEEAGR